MSSTLKLAYWNIRGYAEAIRTLLRYTQTPFEDVRHEFGTGDAFPTRDLWFKEKFTHGLDFPNLPYLIDGDFKISQSIAILKYLARQHNLLDSSSPQVLAHQEMLETQLLDIRTRLINALYNTVYPTEEDWQAERGNVLKDLAVWLGQLEAWLAKENKSWLAGDKLTYVDFLAYEILDWYRELIQADCLEPFTLLSAYVARFEELPQLKEYLGSDEYRKAHILSPWARLGYRSEV
uniref:glutathione transferase n=1 Tax=Acarus siro TaxID=66546 RepID=B0KZJ1_ACASI|nr:allergen Aca s 8 [Acarus siro]